VSKARYILGATCLVVATAAASVAPATASAAPAAASHARHISTKRLLSRLTVKAAHPAGYERSKFKLWDTHPDGCNTRDKVLIRDAKRKPHIGAGCALTHGKWVSPYDGITTTNPTDVQIDHVVPLAAAWRAGAWKWDPKTREAYANDRGTSYDLLAVSAHSNESKSDKGPDQWLPPRTSFDCRYMADYTAVLWRWRLTIDRTEHRFLHSHLAACGWPHMVEPKRPPIGTGSPGTPGGGSGPHKGVKITSIYFDSPGSDTGSNSSLNHEWVKIVNTSNSTATLTGWTLVDASQNSYQFGSFTLKPGAAVRVRTGSGNDKAHNVYQGSGSYIWNNTGDTATLAAGNGKRVDRCAYTQASDPEARC
jgi:hypothetical protein